MLTDLHLPASYRSHTTYETRAEAFDLGISEFSRIPAERMDLQVQVSDKRQLELFGAALAEQCILFRIISEVEEHGLSFAWLTMPCYATLSFCSSVCSGTEGPAVGEWNSASPISGSE